MKPAPPTLTEFMVVNGMAVGATLWLFLWHEPVMFLKGLASALLALLAAYRPMVGCRSRWSRALVLYATMLAFFFVVGVVMNWNHRVGDNPAGSWLARLDGALRTVLLGHIGAVIGYPLLLFANSLLDWRSRNPR